jgi:hypothetical protein
MTRHGGEMGRQRTWLKERSYGKKGRYKQGVPSSDHLESRERVAGMDGDGLRGERLVEIYPHQRDEKSE